MITIISTLLKSIKEALPKSPIFVFFLCSFFTFGQSLHLFSDSASFFGITGEAEYTYIKNGKQHIKHKGFKFVATPIDSANSSYLQQTTVIGSYSASKKNSDWNFNTTRLLPAKAQRIEGYNVIQSGNGHERNIKASFSDGVATQRWSVYENMIKNGVVSDTIYKASVNFKENRYSGKLISQNKSKKLQGTINENGLLDGEWIFFTNPENQETRIYKNGVLLAQELILDNKKIVLSHQNNPGETVDSVHFWEEIELGDLYYKIIVERAHLLNQGNAEETTKLIHQTNSFIQKSISSFVDYNNNYIWSFDDNDSLISNPKIRIKAYPLNEQEIIKLEEAYVMLSKIDSLIQSFLNDPQVEINKHSYEDLAKYYEVFKVYEKELDKLTLLINKLRLPSYRYIDKNKAIPVLFKGVNYPQHIKYTYKDSIKQLAIDFPATLTTENTTITNLHEYILNINKRFDNYSSVILPIIEKNRKRIQIAEREQQLVQLKDSLIGLFSNSYGFLDYNMFHENIGTELIDYVNKTFIDYANDSIENRIINIDSTYSCFIAFRQIYSQLTEYPKKMQRLDEKYTREVWSPVTFTYMTEVVKERLYNAFKNNLLEYYMEQLKNNISCAETSSILNEFNTTIDKMNKLRDKDTSEIERKLKRVYDPEEIIRIIML